MSKKSSSSWLLTRLGAFRWRIGLDLLTVSLGCLAAAIDPMLMRILIDRALPERNLRWALGLAGGIGICYFSRSALHAVGALVDVSIAHRCLRDLRIALLNHLNRLSADFHEQTPTGELLTRIEKDAEQIATFAADITNNIVRAVLLFIMNLGMMAYLNLPMTLTIVPLIPIFVFIQRRFRVLLMARAEETQRESGTTSSILCEHLAAVPQIQFLCAEATSVKRTVSAWDLLFRKHSALWKTQTLFTLSINAVFVLAILSVLGFGSWKVFEDVLTIGGLVAFYTYSTRAFEPINSAMDLYGRLQSVRVSIRRVRELLEREPTVQDLGRRGLDLANPNQGFMIREVSFSYGGRAAVKNVSLCIEAGERIGIIGASGSGKSTLAKLLVRAVDPDRGSIVLDGHPITEYRLDSLRGTVCYVQQYPILFQGTLRENLLYANPHVTAVELIGAASAAQLAPLINQLPSGLDTLLGPGAAGISGGERQRLALARALLRRSPILILDESTSALDSPTERTVLTSIANYRKFQTTIVISHRIRSLVWVDRFVLLNKGEVVAIGPHSTLYSDSDLYRSLFDSANTESIQK